MLVYCVILAVLQTQPVATLEINPTDTEWTAPGVVVEELARVDLLAYGEPMNVGDESGRPHLACQAFFIDTEEGVRWRVVVVYRDKVVVLEQNREPREIYPGYDDCRYAVFSPNGRYALVGAEVGTEQAPECTYTLVDLDDETNLLFPRSFDVALEPVFWVSDDGSLAMLAHGRRRLRYDLDTQGVPWEAQNAPDTLFFYDPSLEQTGYHVTPSGIPRVRISRDGKSILILEDTRDLISVDRIGDEIWSRQVVETNREHDVHYTFSLSGNGSTAVHSRLSGIYVYDANGGALTHEYSGEYTVEKSLEISDDGSHISVLYSGYLTDIKLTNGRACSAVVETLAWPVMLSAHGSGEKLLLLIGRYPHDINTVSYSLLSEDNTVMWLSPWANSSEIEFSGNVDARGLYRPWAGRVETDHCGHFAYTCEDLVRIVQVNY